MGGNEILVIGLAAPVGVASTLIRQALQALLPSLALGRCSLAIGSLRSLFASALAALLPRWRSVDAHSLSAHFVHAFTSGYRGGPIPPLAQEFL